MFKRQKITPYSITIRDADTGDFYIDYYETPNDLFHAAAKFCLFSDLTDDEITEIKVGGWEAEYYGWLPDMEARFVNKSNHEEILWDSFYPEWEH